MRRLASSVCHTVPSSPSRKAMRRRMVATAHVLEVRVLVVATTAMVVMVMATMVVATATVVAMAMAATAVPTESKNPLEVLADL